MRFFLYIFFCCSIAIANANKGSENETNSTAKNSIKASSLLSSKLLSSISLHSTSQYNADELQYFSYVNPEAPKGGTFRIIQIGTFENLNIFAKKGITAESIELIYDKLMQANKEEPATLYPLLATSLQLLPDNSGVIFNLNPNAKFHDGHPVTAEDVVFSFKAFTQQGSFFYKSYYSEIDSVKVLTTHQVQFNFIHTSNTDLPYMIAQLPVLPKHFNRNGATKSYNNALDIPLGSGPYKIESINPSQRITLKKVDNYWGKDLSVNKGRYNFDSLIYDYFLDINLAREALKSGKYDFFMEVTSQNWESFKNSKAVKKNLLLMREISTLDTSPFQGFVFNHRKSKFKNIYIRQALTQLFDFNKINRSLFYNSYLRANSYFPNSVMSATGTPIDGELQLLQPWSNHLPEELFTQKFTLPSGNSKERKSIALELFKKAGFSLHQGQLIDKDKKVFSIDFLTYNNMYDNIISAFADYLKSLGIAVSIRSVDLPVYTNNLRNFDFDMIMYAWNQSSTPGSEQYFYWGSQFADTPMTNNLAGINSPIVDDMITNIVKAKNKQELRDSVKALDRVLLWGYYTIPQWYFPKYRIISSSSVLLPSSKPLYGIDIHSWYFDLKAISQAKNTDLILEKSYFKDNLLLLCALVFIVFLSILILAKARKKRKKDKINIELI
jgi:microcin C transport system substrate-binding protein